MQVDASKCVGCGRCIPFCPVDARSLGRLPGNGRVTLIIDSDRCVECGVCLRSGICPTDAMFQETLEMPRLIRAILSDPLIEFKATGVPGRGTEEIKTNEITGRIRFGYAGVGIEMGRPGVSTSWEDVEKVTRAVAKLGVGFCEGNPVTHFMADRATGDLMPDVVKEKSLSAIIEFDVPLEKLAEVLRVLREITPQLDTVYTLEVSCKVHPDGSLPVLPIIEQAGYTVLPNSKNNLGMGRPRFREPGEEDVA